MQISTREQLRIILSVVLGLVPRGLRRAYGEKATASSDPAKKEIVARLVEGIDQHFEVVEKPAPPVVPPMMSQKDKT